MSWRERERGRGKSRTCWCLYVIGVLRRRRCACREKAQALARPRLARGRRCSAADRSQADGGSNFQAPSGLFGRVRMRMSSLWSTGSKVGVMMGLTSHKMYRSGRSRLGGVDVCVLVCLEILWWGGKRERDRIRECAWRNSFECKCVPDLTIS